MLFTRMQTIHTKRQSVITWPPLHHHTNGIVDYCFVKYTILSTFKLLRYAFTFLIHNLLFPTVTIGLYFSSLYETVKYVRILFYQRLLSWTIWYFSLVSVYFSIQYLCFNRACTYKFSTSLCSICHCHILITFFFWGMQISVKNKFTSLQSPIRRLIMLLL